MSRVTRRPTPTCVFAAHAQQQLHNDQWRTLINHCRRWRVHCADLCLLAINNIKFVFQVSNIIDLLQQNTNKTNLIMTSCSFFLRVISFIMLHLTRFVLWLKTVHALQIDKIHEWLLQTWFKLWPHSKTSHAFPQQSLVCCTVKLKSTYSPRQTAIFVVSVVTLCHVKEEIIPMYPLASGRQ